MSQRRIVFRPLLLAVLLAAGSMPAVGAPRQPPPPPPKKGPVDYLESLLPWTQVEPAPDFVRQSRPAAPGPFMPVGTEPRDQELRIKSPAELAAMKADLEQARSAHETLRAHPPRLTNSAAPVPAAAPTKAAAAKPTSKRTAKRKAPAAD